MSKLNLKILLIALAYLLNVAHDALPHSHDDSNSAIDSNIFISLISPPYISLYNLQFE